MCFLLLCLIWCLVFLYRKDFTLQFNSENVASTSVFYLLQCTCLSMARRSHSIYQEKAKQRQHLYHKFVYNRFMWGECVCVSVLLCHHVYIYTRKGCISNFQIIELYNFRRYIIRESVDSLCRDGADAQYHAILKQKHITSPQTR